MPEHHLDTAEQFEKALNSPKQSWLLGAGVSFPSNVPLMIPLTKRVLHSAREDSFKYDEDALRLIDFIEGDIDEGAHIEIFLTHLSDLISLSQRSRNNIVLINDQEISKLKLTEVHIKILQLIAETIRWGYCPPGENGEGEKIGSPGKSIVEVKDHRDFISAVFRSGRAGLESIRGPVEFFTTNYDTLIEDALALNQIPYDDGFVGGGLGFWKGFSQREVASARAVVTKLHGSIDWFRPKESPSPLLRVRHGETYPAEGGAVLIYPQATKYMNSQLDPFSDLFARFRNRLGDGVDHVLLICGYSFGDDHINADIEIAMSRAGSQLTILAFSSGGGGSFPETLENWRNLSWGDRIYIAGKRGLYRGNRGPFFSVENGERDWWTFCGVKTLIAEGLPTDIQEAIQ